MVFYLICFVLIIYIWASIFFFYNPKLLHSIKSKRIDYSKHEFGYWLGAHRGGSAEGVENTLQNHLRAKELNVSFWEMDVRLTKDQHVVVAHDKDLKRYWGIDKKFNQLNYNELPPIQDHLQLHFSDKYLDTTQIKDRKFPLFSDVWRELGDMPINVELKSNEDELMDQMYEIITKYNKQHQTVWGSVNKNCVQRMQKLYPEIPRFAASFEVYRCILAFFLLYLPFISIDFDTIQVPIVTAGFVHNLNRETKPSRLNCIR